MYTKWIAARKLRLNNKKIVRKKEMFHFLNAWESSSWKLTSPLTRRYSRKHLRQLDRMWLLCLQNSVHTNFLWINLKVLSILLYFTFKHSPKLPGRSNWKAISVNLKFSTKGDSERKIRYICLNGVLAIQQSVFSCGQDIKLHFFWVVGKCWGHQFRTLANSEIFVSSEAVAN